MAGLLADIYSYGDTLKRKVNGLMQDPRGTLEQFVGQLGDTASQNSELMAQAGWIPGQKAASTPQQQAIARGLLADQGAQMGMAGATVWHGSPHKFDKFDSGKIGTGEGAQAYGHGLYLAESPDVAKMYKDKLTDPAFKYAGQNQAKARLNEKIAKRVESIDPERAAKLRDEVASLDPEGALYKVDLPDEHIAKMLDLDRTLASQNPEVLRALGLSDEVALDWTRGRQTQNLPAEANHFYSQLSETLGSPAKASDFLRQKGIPGNRYLDGGSRGAGQGSSNYVVFPGNEGLLSIIERNGQQLK